MNDRLGLVEYWRVYLEPLGVFQKIAKKMLSLLD
jgi:hypothetical protein